MLNPQLLRLRYSFDFLFVSKKYILLRRDKISRHTNK